MKRLLIETLLKDVENKVKEILNIEGFFNLKNINRYSDSYVVDFKFTSDRVKNTEWQIQTIIKLLKHLIKTKQIEPVEELNFYIMTEHTNGFLDQDDFKDEEEYIVN